MDEMTIPEIQNKMSSDELTAQSLTEMYLERIHELDKQGPAINAVIELNPDAIAIAIDLDRERQANGPRGPLHGIPVMLKDNIDTGDRMKTSAGSLALAESTAAEDSYVASKLRQAGAVILGKTNLSEWANFRSSHSSSGWSSRGGQTHNPYALDRNPCGSSSGSAVAVASNLCAAAIGTETDGSIVCPAHINSIVGLKPTVGLVGRSGIIPIAHSQDTAGPMARTVTDAAILLGALTGIDPRDPTTKDSVGKSCTDYTQYLDKDGLCGARIGVAREYFGSNDKVDRIVEKCIDVMASLGAIIVDPINLGIDNEELRNAEIEVLLTEFKSDLDLYLGRLGPDVPVHSVKELIDFNEQHKDRVMPYFGQERLLAAVEKGPLTGDSYRKALENGRRLTRTDGIDAALTIHELDAIVAPSGGPAWLTDWINGDHYGGSSSSPAAVAGYPNITVPAGYIYGLPIGISFFSGAYQEPTLIKLAYAFEQATHTRRPPQFLESVVW